MGAESPIHFEIHTPLDDGTLPPRMAANDQRGLPEAVRAKTAIIIGSGPSARHGALWRRLRAIHYGPHPQDNPRIVACNGALKLFIEHGLTPDLWTCCDPQPEVLNFLPDIPPAHVDYLLATKCPPELFERLKYRNVWAWRLDDTQSAPGKVHIPCAVSITLVTMNLLRFMGYHRFEMYGWDCCYLDGQHHATEQPEPEGRMPFEIHDETGATLHSFDINGSWAAELSDACVQAHNYQAMGYEIVVHGPGAVGALLRAKKLIA